MAKSQTLTTNIVINAKTGNGFSEVGSTLEHLGEIVSGVSTPLLQFGQESVEVYRDYQTAMLDAEVALATTYGKGSVELKKVMSDLDVAASEWARTTVFHTNDVAEAIANAAHAGWDYEQIMTGIPAAIDLARAGGMDLSSAVDYVVKSTNAAGIEFQDMSDWMNEWVFAANSSASTVEEFGEAMTAMGSTMRFAANPEELMTLIAVTADAGVTGSQAGTMIRSALMRLVSPTDKATEAMEALGASTEELDEIASKSDEINEAMEILTDNGFTGLYDANGKMKPVLQTFEELREALAKAAGGYENLTDNNEAAMKVLGAIFPTRTITEALNLINAAENNWGGLYDRLMAGEAEGYTQFASELMGSGLDGAIRIAESRVENLKKSVGEELEPIVTDVAGMIGDLADNLAGMDPTAFSAIVSGLEVIAVAGPGLMLAGGAMKLIGAAAATFSGAGGFILAAVAIGAAAAAWRDLDESYYKNTFGDIALDSTAVAGYLTDISQDFQNASKDVDAYRQALFDAHTQYTDFTSTLSKNLIQDVLTGKNLSDADKEAYYKQGENIGEQLVNGIQNGYDLTAADVERTWGGEEGVDASPLATGIMATLAAAMERDIAQAESLSQQLRDALTSAFADNTITDEERAAIQAPIDEMNKLIAKQQAIDNYVEEQSMLRKAQSLGIDGFREVVDMVDQQRSEQLEELMRDQDRTYAMMEAEGYSDRELSELRSQQQAAVGRFRGRMDKLVGDTAQMVLESSLPEEAGALNALVKDYIEKGGRLDETGNAYKAFKDATDGQEILSMGKLVTEAVEAMGGYENLLSQADLFTRTGDTDLAASYQRMAAMYDIFGHGQEGTTVTAESAQNVGMDYEATYANLENALGDATVSAISKALFAQESGTIPDWRGFLGGAGYEAVSSLAGKNRGDLTSFLAGFSEAEEYQVHIQPVIDEMNEPIEITAAPRFEATSGSYDLGDGQSVEVDVEGDTASIEGDISALDNQTLTEILEGDPTALHATIRGEDGQLIWTYVDGHPEGLESAINTYDGRHITVYIDTQETITRTINERTASAGGGRKFATGGRATEPSIFGEGTLPEWAIPEEHSERTASLLDAARAASGFTWPEIFARFGGLNGNPENVATSIVYAPTINAADATGVEQALAADKDRFERWFRDHQMREAMEVYA